MHTEVAYCVGNHVHIDYSQVSMLDHTNSLVQDKEVRTSSSSAKTTVHRIPANWIPNNPHYQNFN